MKTTLSWFASSTLMAIYAMASMPVLADDDLLTRLREDFSSKGPATMERVLVQDEVQKACSGYPVQLSDAKVQSLLASQLKTVNYPQDGKFLGDWKAGEKIAQNGRGMQSSDSINTANGGNCYACHQLAKEEISFGNIGPTLYQYGKLRGDSEAVVKYTWTKLYNSQAITPCSQMPRFGHSGILTEEQLKDVMALLFDKTSPVNQ